MNIEMLNRVFDNHLAAVEADGIQVKTIGQLIDAAVNNEQIVIQVLKNFKVELNFNQPHEIAAGSLFNVNNSADFLEYLNSITAIYN